MTDDPGAGGRLNEEEKLFLHQVARQAVEAAALDQPAPNPVDLAEEAGIDIQRRLIDPRGVFVTLTQEGRLRGCIGYIEGIKPLIEAVADNGRSAAVADPRFPPVTGRELEDIHIEISALTPLVAVDGPDSIIIGRHGVVLAKQGRRAVFLPQVASEQGWDRDATLTHLALKAGLGPDSWRQGAEFLVFEAEVF